MNLGLKNSTNDGSQTRMKRYDEILTKRAEDSIGTTSLESQ